QSEEQRLFARQWLVFLQQSKQRLTAQVPEFVNLVATTISSLCGPDNFEQLGVKHFDLVILEEADQVREPELVQVSQYGLRWVFVGEPTWCGPIRRETDARTNGASSTPDQPFYRLWRQLHCDLQSLPYGWSYENRRLCCRMHPIRAEE